MFHRLALDSIEHSAQCLFYIFQTKSDLLRGQKLINTAPNVLRWLNTVFQGKYLPSLSINYDAKNKILEKLPPQLY